MKVFVCGFGTIGQGTVEAIMKKQDFFKKRYNKEVRIVGAMDSKTYVIDQDGLDPQALLDTKKKTGKVGTDTYTKSTDVMDKLDFDVLIEVTPTNIEDGGVGLENIKYALNREIDVVTVNKGPLALKYREIMDLAKKKGCMIGFEGTVGGAMPIIDLCLDDLAGEKIKSIRGIFNGTCNYILSKMDNGQPFEQALREAQQQGYAETDPTADIEGYDSACKVVILANSVFGRNVTFDDVDITGITSINADAVGLARANGMVIRLIGEVSPTKLEVAPRLIPKGHPLSLPGTLNTAEITTEMAGPILISGRGAGRMETASAIISDLVAVLDKRFGE
ncbi:homoserine dehydrogenase [methanogenic archaeon mixed culture ISO4-G1]|nr:homoserine dehydrogenase [methanogenic archaeon mixed culture ISO4-G1]